MGQRLFWHVTRGVPPARPGGVEPAIDADSAPWWEAVAQRRFLLPKCNLCGFRWFPPTPGCPRCGSVSTELSPASGSGRVYSWVVIHRALSVGTTPEVPYVIGAITLEEGGRIFGRLLASPTDSRLRADEPVSVCFYTVSEVTLVGFEFANRPNDLGSL
jgi:uncharacterized OB-fold protein